MDLTNFVNQQVFQPLEHDLKSDMWIECRNMITTCFLHNFKENLKFARALYSLSKNVEIKPSQLCTTFMKIQRVTRSISVDPIKGTTGLCELFITTNGQFLLDNDLFEQMFELLSKWTGMLHRCNAASCLADCECRPKFCDQIIASTHEDFNMLCKEERPGIALFHSFCGTMIHRASAMLDEINQHIPSYKLIDSYNCQGLRKLLMENGIGFQMIYTQAGHLWLHIANEDDRCGAKRFEQLMRPVRDNNFL